MESNEGEHLCWVCDEDPAFDLRAEVRALLDEVERLEQRLCDEGVNP
jgi:hypothetical protein